MTRCGVSRTQEMLDEASRRLGRPAVQIPQIPGGACY
jgi:hypothetical protein